MRIMNFHLSVVQDSTGSTIFDGDKNINITIMTKRLTKKKKKRKMEMRFLKKPMVWCQSERR